ncbi:MAG: clostripain-related cysteine peptidase [bacterium]|nr:clostripain-related cysteine peptidase [bacterium]
MNRLRSKQVISILALTSAFLLFSACGNNKSLVSTEITEREPATGESWTVMLYMCGGIDERLYGTASNSLNELTRVKYPENINVIVQTGGSYGWHTSGIDTNYLDRFMAQNKSLQLLERQEQDDMSKSIVLTDFIDWCEGTYPADHYALIIHGSGSNSAYGIAHDEAYENHSLTLPIISKAISNADMHFDIIGFDAGLTASAETAYLLSTSADYLVASQEVMAEGGWNYSGWLKYIKENPTSSVADVAKAVCDTYMDECKRDNTDEMATMSVTQLSEITGLSQSIEGMAGELSSSPDSLSDYSIVSRAVDKTMCFGSNTDEEGYSNMIDLNDLAVKTSPVADKTSGRVQEELEKAVIYWVNGKYRSEACGMSIFYPLNQSSDELPRYMDLCPFKRYTEFISETAANADTGNTVSKSFRDTTAFADYEIERDRMQYQTVPGSTGIELNMVGNMDIVRKVEQRIFRKSNNGFLYLGNAAEIDENREAGIYKTKNAFRFSLMNGHSISLNKVYEGDSYSIYSVPLKIDGAQKNLRIAAVKKSNGKVSYKSLGIHESLGPGSQSSRHTTPLRIYNLVTPLFREYSSGELIEGESFKTWPISLYLSDKNLIDDSYKTDYRVEYIYGNAFTTQSADFDFFENTISYK